MLDGAQDAPRRKVVLVSDIRSYEMYMPLSIMAIGTVAREHGLEPVIVDGQIEEDVARLVREALKEAVLLGVSSHTGPSIATVLEVLKIAREEFPHIPTVWGGYHATQAYRSILNEGLADFVVKGGGEHAFQKILDALGEGSLGAMKRRLTDVSNIAMIDENGELVDNAIVPVDIAAIAPMNYELIDVQRYLRIKPTLRYISSYGCPYACTFCAEPSQSLRRWKDLGAVRVCDEIQHLWTTYQPRRITFVDPNFSTYPERVIDLVHEMKRRNLTIRLSATMRARDVRMIAKKIDLRALRDVGFSTVFVGVESGSDRMLKVLKKSATADDMYTACVLLDAAGIKVHSSFIHDLPGETEADSDLTFALIEKLGPLNNRQSHHFYMPYPSTELFDSISNSRELYAATSQQDWAATSTYGGSDVWSGRPEFRRRVHRRLEALHDRFPSSIPSLVVNRLGGEDRNSEQQFTSFVKTRLGPVDHSEPNFD